MSWEFTCLKCGDCCRNLRISDTAGLLLIPNEIKFIPHDSLEPCLGKWKSPKHNDFEIWAYQLIDDSCPHSSENQCKFYEKRPLASQAYPFRVRYDYGDDYLMHLAPECQAVIKDRESNTFARAKRRPGYEDIHLLGGPDSVEKEKRLVKGILLDEVFREEIVEITKSSG